MCAAGPFNAPRSTYPVRHRTVRLTQLKLAGFKSFVDPTVIPVPSQLVGVVGPNGCGKSNIIDAVRWVLGEAKASELRGESMQDVIFNGSGNRKPAARASVEMVFDNTEGRAAGQWSAYSEIAVRRVLTRDGTSSYYVNNQQVRRRDIHDIFLGTGLGARGYAIIGQGMINRLIEARPEELRVFLEEAAGVSRYKERRRETENRLSDTRENLTRVEDILRELGSQLDKLEAQAEVARKYRELQADGEKKQFALWLLKETGARDERERKNQDMARAQNDLEAAIAGLRAGEAELESRRQAHYAASDAVHAAQGQLYEANAQVSRLEAEIRHVVDSRNRLQARREQLQAQIAEWNSQQEHCTEQIALAEEDLATGAARTEEARAAAEDAQAGLPAIEARPQGQTPLASLLRVTDPDLRTLLNQWLAGLYTAADLTQALGGRASLPAGAAYVVKAGHLVDAHSVRFYAPDSEQAGLLARQQEIENLQREIKAQQLIADQARAAVARAEAAWQQVSQAIAPARQRVAEVTRRVHDIQLEHSRLQQQAEQSGERAARLRQDLEELAAHEEDLRATREEAEVRFEALDGELAEHQSRFSDAEIDGETLSAQADAARTRLRELERAAQEAEFAERGVQVRITDLQRNRQLAADQSQRAATELQQLETDLVDLDASASQAGLQDALELRAEREEALTRARLELDNLSALMRGADEERMQQERGLEPLRARITELQLQEQAARLAEEQFTEQLNAREVDRETLARELAEMPDEWRKASWLQSEVGRISRQVDALGPVNLAALDELNTSRERKTFLDAQQQDLLTAMETLEDAIRKIDRETRELLQETFNTVNRHFGELFPKLFGGGEARLTMTGDEILDAGVQVMAQPPGKRNSTIHLLSGGEKALTATALVFALFKLNPAPFCLLDEVDAPLDDANTERYANLVSNMSEQTQFLFISHNKIAMQMAKQLIGVTMQEQGVSRIVAVDIDSAVQMAAEA
ncbi:putative chromosome partition protein [Bordetella bronchiseptica MO211]|nr:putative chromosome partition protein [Bordetella bronchiseptica MO211]